MGSNPAAPTNFSKIIVVLPVPFADAGERGGMSGMVIADTKKAGQ
ncbi:hypothetical protein PZ897_02975 [Hoeflea sp. YIM 152468]|nr:hypothetical protein [Hoeflea sp. YIM 152468]MDF1607132.1 hypothetical protein [Hoeflea sp. YIM 152468]